MAFEGLTSPFEPFSAAPLTGSFQSMSFLFHRFAPADFGARQLLPALRTCLCRSVTGASKNQKGPNCGCK
jgi:hypothetical protein